jgi:hypothetical protein
MINNNPGIINKLTLNRLLIFAALVLTLNLLTTGYAFHVLLPLLKALYLAAVMLIYGFAALYLPGGKKHRLPAEPAAFTAAIAAGLMISTLFFFLACFFKILSPWLITLYYLAPLFLLPLMFKKKNQSQYFIKICQSFFKRPAVEYLVFIFPLIYACLPPSFYDSLAYHLGIPNLYLQNHGFVAAPQLFYANTFIYYEVSLIPAVFAGDLAPRLFHFLMGMLLILSAMDFAVRFFDLKKRHIPLLAIVSMPMSIFLLTAVKNDLLSALFILCGIRCFMEDKKYLSALFWGFSLGIKYTNAIPLAIFLLFQLIQTIKNKRPRFGVYVKQMIIFGIIACAVLVPLLVKNYKFTGNPVFPFFHRHFENKIQYWDASRFTLLEKDAKKLFQSAGDVLKFPLTISFEELGSGGVVGPLYLMLLPFLLVKRPKRLMLLFFALLTLLVGGNFKLSTRVWYIAFLFLAIYAAAAYETVSQKIMPVLFYIIIGFNLVTAFGLHEYLYRSYNLFAGQMTAEQYKGAAFPAYKGISYVNENAPPGSRALLVGEARGYYLQRPYTVSSGYDYSILRKYLEKSEDAGAFIKALKAEGIEYIIFNAPEFNRLQTDYQRLTEGEHKRALEYLKRLTPVFQDKDGGIYVLRVI